MTYINRNERIYSELVKNINRLIQSGDNLDDCFQEVKTYIFQNFDNQQASRKNNDIVHLQSRYSRIKADKRTQQVTYSDYQLVLNVITKDMQELVETLKPEGVTIDISRLFSDNHTTDLFWEFEENFYAVLEFPNGFTRIDAIFEQFAREMKTTSKVRLDRFFFEEGKKKRIDEARYESLTESEKNSVTTESMDWSDAIIIFKKLQDRFYGEALIRKRHEREEIEIWSKGDFFSKGEILLDVIKWFHSCSDYPQTLTEPFHLKMPYSSLQFFQTIPLQE